MRLKYDLRLMAREPIMVLFAILPLFLFFLFRFGLPAVSGLLPEEIGFDISKYDTYILTISLAMTPYMTGALSGFLMLDEKDGNVLELILVTPVGFRGYLFGRLAIPMVLSLIYTIIVFIVFAGYYDSLTILPGVMLLVTAEGWITALLLFSLAKNKVQGLTVAKGLGLLLLPVFFDLFGNKVLEIIALFSPYYWLYAYLDEGGAITLLIGLCVSAAWLSAMLYLGFRRIYMFRKLFI